MEGDIKEDTKSQNIYFSYTKIVQEVNNSLIFRRFEECGNLCERGINEAKTCPENPASILTIEALTVAAIQTYAELNRWREVVPYVIQVYDGVETCPAKVIQMCVLLHARMKDYAMCATLTGIWLKIPENFSCPDYSKVVEIFIANVLVPQQHWDQVDAFLSSCPGLVDKKKQSFQRSCRKIKHQIEQDSLDKIDELDSVEETETGCKDKDALSESDNNRPDANTSAPFQDMDISIFQKFFSKVTDWLTSATPQLWVTVARNASLFAVIIYLVMTKANVEFLSWKKLQLLWATVVRLWKAMFAPYHLAGK